MKNPDIIKSGAIILKDRRILIVKPKDKEFWLFVGGKVEDGVSIEESLIREVKEELDVNIIGEPTQYFESPLEKAAGDPQERTVQIIAFMVEVDSIPKPSREIEEIHWLSKSEFDEEKFNLDSILKKHTIPRLIEEGYM